MTTTASAWAGTGSPGMTGEEAAAATGFIAAGAAFGGPVGCVIAMLAVGIEQAFIKSGWDKPDLLTRLGLTAEELTERRMKLAAEAEQQLAQARERAAERAKLREMYRQQLRNHRAAGPEGDRPGMPDGMVRNPWEFLTDVLAASKSRYRLLDRKMTEGNEKITGMYPAIGAFFGDLFRFITGFIEGAKLGRQQWQQQYGKNSTVDDGPTITPDAERPAVKIPAVIPAPGPTPEPAAGSVPAPGPGPTPLTPPGQGSLNGQPAQGGLPTGPAGPGEGTAVEGEIMTADGTTVLSAGAAPAHQGQSGDTNLDRILQAFLPIPPLLASVRQQLPDAQRMQQLIAQRIEVIRTLGGLYGVPRVVWLYLAEAGQTTRALENGLQIIATDNAMAAELADEAVMAMRPAQDDLQVVHAEGASGELFASAAEAGI